MSLKRKRHALFLRAATLHEGSLKAPCHYCGNRFKFKHLTLDHVVRQRDGGTHAMENLVLACQLCNWAREHQVGKFVITRHRQILGIL